MVRIVELDLGLKDRIQTFNENSIKLCSKLEILL